MTTQNAVFSPSSTTTWKRCPILYQLQREGIVARALGNRELTGALGSAYAQGLHVYYRGRQAGVSVGEAPVDAALGYLKAQREAWQSEGRRMPESMEAQSAALEPRAERAVRYTLAHDPVPPTWQIVAVEESLGPEYGNARPDLVVRDDMGHVMPADHKLKLTLGRTASERSYKWERARGDWRDSDQMYHYVWSLAQRYPLAPKYIIYFLELEPRPAQRVEEFGVTLEAVRTWHANQTYAWDAMLYQQKYPVAVWRAAVHTDQFGQCEMYDWCYGAPITRDIEYTKRIRL
jgi:hypothetical protein